MKTKNQLAVIQKKLPADMRKLASAVGALAAASTPDDIRKCEKALDTLEVFMANSGLFKTGELCEINGTRMRARWKLGRALAKAERRQGARTLSADRTKWFRAMIDEIDLKRTSALEAQRIGCLPEKELEHEISEARAKEQLLYFSYLLIVARPYWYEESRKHKHRMIEQTARQHDTPEQFGPFALLYADPPWKYHTYSEKGLHHSPDQHYPTLSDDEIIDFRIDGKRIPDIMFDDAACFLWCTSSNIERALRIMSAWDFETTTSAVWVKDRTGQGLVFLNQHEVLIYGKRGNMPGPLFLPPSVFFAPRLEHSEKPVIVRQALEKMYPDFSAATRLELFARGAVDGWSVYGHEAQREAAE